MKKFLASLAVVLLLLGIFLGTSNRAHAATLGCALQLPTNPLTAEGLSAPFVLKGCSESDPNVQAFVQATIVNPASGAISVYNPLVITDGTKPAIKPVVPVLAKGDVVGIWFGSNGPPLKLIAATGRTLDDANCVNGWHRSIFGQVSDCNAIFFFDAANKAIAAGKLKVPALGTAKDGLPCPTTRDFSIVDQDPNDNVTALYLLTPSGQTAQDTAANRAALPTATVQFNGSDELVLTLVDQALGCTPFEAPNMADNGALVPALALNELSAAANQAAPIALVPPTDPMTEVRNSPNWHKQNAYRQMVDQPLVSGPNTSVAFCNGLLGATARLQNDESLTAAAPSPFPSIGNSLFTFLAARFAGSWQMLGCAGNPPVTLITDVNGVVIGASYQVP